MDPRHLGNFNGNPLSGGSRPYLTILLYIKQANQKIFINLCSKVNDRASIFGPKLKSKPAPQRHPTSSFPISSEYILSLTYLKVPMFLRKNTKLKNNTKLKKNTKLRKNTTQIKNTKIKGKHQFSSIQQ